MRDSGQWGLETEINLLQPLNTNTVNQDTFSFDKGGPAIINNGVNRDGGITELYENESYISEADYVYISSNGLVVGIDVDGSVTTTTSNSAPTAPTVPSDLLYPSETLTPGGGFGNVVKIGKLNTFSFFVKKHIPSYYLDCVVSSDSTILAIRYNAPTALILDELNPSTMAVLNSSTISVTSCSSPPSVAIARANTLTYATLKSTSGLIYNPGAGTAVHYWRNGTNYSTGFLADPSYSGFSCYYNGGTVVFTLISSGVSYGCYNSVPGNFVAYVNTLTYAGSGVTVAPCMLGDSGADVLAVANTTLKLGAMTTSSRCPIFYVLVSAAGAVTTATAYGTLFSGSGTTEGNFTMDYGVVTPYGASGLYHINGGTGYGSFHLATSFVSSAPTVAPTGLGLISYPQLDVNHKMLTVRSVKGQISLLAGTRGSSSDTLDSGNIVNDYAGGSFEYDLMSGSPANNGLLAGARNYYFYPLSWRGSTSYSGTCIYKLNNGDFVCVTSTAVPQFSELAPGVVTVNTLSAWGAIIDINAGIMYYNLSAYTSSFFFDRTGSELVYLKIFNKYSSSIDQGQLASSSAVIVPMASSSTTTVGWSVWDGTTGAYSGDFYATTANALGPFAPHAGIYVFNANVPPGGDSLFENGGIQMLNAVSLQTPNYFGYYLFAVGGGSNLLPWVTANVFLLQGTYYAYNNEYVYQITLTNGSSGTIQGAPVAVAYAVGLRYLCVSPNKAFFVSSYDNSVYFFDGGRSLRKFFEANQKPNITFGAFNVRDNALYLLTDTSVITLRDEQVGGEVNAEGLQITENPLPAAWTATSYLRSTANGLYYIMGDSLYTRTYEAEGTIIPMDYRTAHYCPAEWLTMQVGRICGHFYCASNLTSTFRITFYYVGVDGKSGSVSAILSSSTRNTDGYFRFSWSPSVANVIAGSVRVQHLDYVQKIVLMELLMYVKPSAEIIPLAEVTAEV